MTMSCGVGSPPASPTAPTAPTSSALGQPAQVAEAPGETGAARLHRGPEQPGVGDPDELHVQGAGGVRHRRRAGLRALDRLGEHRDLDPLAGRVGQAPLDAVDLDLRQPGPPGDRGRERRHVDELHTDVCVGRVDDPIGVVRGTAR